jgi:hypothetical protein
MITMILVSNRPPFHVQISQLLVALWARFLLPLLVRDRHERVQRMTAQMKSIYSRFKPTVVELAVPTGLDEDDVISRLNVPESDSLPALVKPGELFVHNRQLSRKEAESLMDFDKLRTVVIDARNHRARGPLTLPKLYKISPLVKRRGWMSEVLIEGVQEDWRRLIESSYPEHKDDQSLSVEHLPNEHC